MSDFNQGDPVQWRNNALPEGETVEEWPPMTQGIVTELKQVQVNDALETVALVTTPDEFTWWVLTKNLSHV